MATQATHWITAGLVAGSLWAGGAQATLIENGGFENALLDPWTCFAPTAFDRLCQPIDDPRTGAQALLAYHNAGGGILEQVIPTVPGASYDFSAWSKTLLDLPENVLRYSLDGAPFVEVPRTVTFAEMTDSFTAQGAQTPIRFFIQTAEGTGSWRLDDVVVSLRSLPSDLPSLIVNGGFENDLLDPWTCFAPTAFDRLCQPIEDPHTGAQALLAYHNAGGGILEQVIPTVPGARYDFSAWSKTLLDLPENVLRYSLDGAPFVEVPRTTAFAPMADSFTAQGAQTPIRFFFQTAEGAGSWRLDDVIVTLRSLPATPEAVIPAPPAAPLLAAALAGLWALRRRRS